MLFCLSTGSALRFAVQTSISPVSGGRVGVPKAVVMLVTDKSTDDVKEAVNEALAAGNQGTIETSRYLKVQVLLLEFTDKSLFPQVCQYSQSV